MTLEEFLKVMENFTDVQISSMRIYDFEDIAIQHAYKFKDYENENEDVEMYNNYNNCYSSNY